MSLAAITRPQSRNEEMANSISHGFGLVAAIVGTPFLIIHVARFGDAASIVGASLFAATMLMLYLASTLYHALPDHALPAGKAKRVFRVIEHAAIFLLIAGTYTPFTLGVLRGAWGWTLFGLVWGLAVGGVALKAFNRMSHPIVSTVLYLFMGWLVVIAIDPLSARLTRVCDTAISSGICLS
jgi:hemolysin III